MIKSSWIDYKSVGALTDWRHFTPATVPAEFAGNFAKHPDGTYVVSNGYIALPTVSGVMSTSDSKEVSVTGYTVLALGLYLP